MGIETPLASYDMGGFILLFDVSVDIFHGKFQMVFYQLEVKVFRASTPNIGSFISWISAVSSCRRPPRETDEEKAEIQAGSFKA